jgi:hypothetical protein
MGVKVLLQNVRLSFPNLFAPKVSTDDNGNTTSRFGVALILPKDHPQIQEVRKAMRTAAIDKWKDKGNEIFDVLVRTDKVCLRDGDLKTEWQGFAGNLFISANSKTKPMVVDADKRTALRPQDGRPYAGCYAHASIEIWCQDNKNGKRINASLLAVMFAKHAEPFAGGSLPTDDEFESVPEAEVEQENEFL